MLEYKLDSAATERSRVTSRNSPGQDRPSPGQLRVCLSGALPARAASRHPLTRTSGPARFAAQRVSSCSMAGPAPAGTSARRGRGDAPAGPRPRRTEMRPPAAGRARPCGAGAGRSCVRIAGRVDRRPAGVRPAPCGGCSGDADRDGRVAPARQKENCAHYFTGASTVAPRRFDCCAQALRLFHVQFRSVRRQRREQIKNCSAVAAGRICAAAAGSGRLAPLLLLGRPGPVGVAGPDGPRSRADGRAGAPRSNDSETRLALLIHCESVNHCHNEIDSL